MGFMTRLYTNLFKYGNVCNELKRPFTGVVPNDSETSSLRFVDEIFMQEF